MKLNQTAQVVSQVPREKWYAKLIKSFVGILFIYVAYVSILHEYLKVGMYILGGFLVSQDAVTKFLRMVPAFIADVVNAFKGEKHEGQ